jgi:hypothetical protein
MVAAARCAGRVNALKSENNLAALAMKSLRIPVQAFFICIS